MRKWAKSTLLVFAAFLMVMLVACNNNNSGMSANNNSSDNSANNDTSAGNGNSEGNNNKEETYDNGLPKNKKVELKISIANQGHGVEWVKYAMDTFHKKFPNVSFDADISPKPQKKVTTKIQAGDDEDMYDLMTTMDGALRHELYASGKLATVNDLWDHEVYDTPGKTVKDVVSDSVYKASLDGSGEDQHQFARGYTGNGLWFNVNQFEEHGWNQDPKTWDEFVDLLANIKADGIIPLTFPGKNPNYYRQTFGDNKEVELADAAGNADEYLDRLRHMKAPRYTSKPKKEIMKKLYNLGKKGYFAKGIPALGHIESQMQLMQGKAALDLCGDWIANEMKDSTPDDFKWGYMSPPMTNDPDQTLHVTTNDTGSFYIWNEKPELHIKWAKEFSVWLVNMDVQEKIAAAGSGSVRKDFADDPERLKNMDPGIAAETAYISSHNTIANATNPVVHVTGPNYSKSRSNLKDNITDIVLGKQDPIPVLKKSEELFEKALKNQK